MPASPPSSASSCAVLFRVGALVSMLFIGGCCMPLRAPTAEEMHPPELVVRSVLGGWLVGTPSRCRERASDTWEIRVWRDGTLQEARGWKGQDGVLPPRHITAGEAQALIASARAVRSDILFGDLEVIGRFATDTPYRMIELAEPPRTIDAYARNGAFDRVWNDVVKHMRERSVCR